MPDKWLDLVHVKIAGSPGHSQGLTCKLFGAWSLRAVLLGLTDDVFYADKVIIIYVIRVPSDHTSLFQSLPQNRHQWPILAPVIAKYIMDAGNSAMVRFDDALQDSKQLLFLVWDSMKKRTQMTIHVNAASKRWRIFCIFGRKHLKE